jgi:MFS transporter, PAT family, beta-lactamase induction signal transducer AmpG
MSQVEDGALEGPAEVRGAAPAWFGLLSLPGGVAQGFVSVSLAYVLRQHGASVAAIAGLVSLNLLPQTCRFVFGPVVDMSLTAKRWYLICVGAIVAGFVVMGFAPLTPAGMPLLSGLALLLGIVASAGAAALAAIVAQTVPHARRGSVAGWLQTGGLGGVGLGGGAGLWLSVHAGGPAVAALTLAAACLACILPVLGVRTPSTSTGHGLQVQALGLGRDLCALLRTRQGALAALVVTIPASLGAAANLFPAVAGDWRASADLVAVVTGVLGGLATLPGCILGGYLCDRFARRIVYIWAAIACAAGEAAMAWAPHTPAWFAGMVMANALLLGIGFAAVAAVIFECLGPRAAATTASLLGSLSNVPVVAMTAIVGVVQTRHGSSAMLLTEAGAAVVSIAAYAALAYAWRPAGEGGNVALAAAGA